MSQSLILTLGTQAIMMIVLMSLPLILTAMLVGLTVSILQAVTQIQEQTLSFVPKTICVFSMLILISPWHMSTAKQFLTHLLINLPSYLTR
ncbi:flagellar biosynthetic protein FliQ [bacterium (Candidatus Blackallbacteria) CG17_big_fil_post_rev_8_21_14_2_50_48_46]|uniref:Flagellar biosynthetic protein FliQ n=1 Tax=bacterium (Candidatus Blackallbacteria) CG17_big_fil_post_rev_8_21_14_2_50_48_46 TaxID=2014261 RepID=A0A2M7FYV5_9BACT|nr:MAG: flagellar biosynthetic protein FliQ [bacterium (Candidatus Blackallbacteria) CG18_big_fil_WC_8_21_14_2_50_49_26]PIW14560.1 MAG: flagellar biosynthetic protein FliQ [bacterium (Candidatus Blackallbacteria) CG17_big_fil_post_rev_8_21_14_2_50_48_46]PIW47245.1 MAG: flagellar biosynthetic protein FliQ [bacterium (Candidatus Blackallbacteria) CG13_big_fil_rev_8_21_14_2_50_49_14]